MLQSIFMSLNFFDLVHMVQKLDISSLPYKVCIRFALELHI
jgi:hypothetical protein